jgi:hypothetical protein
METRRVREGGSMRQLLGRALAGAAGVAGLSLVLLCPLPATAQPVSRTAVPARAATTARPATPARPDLARKYQQVTKLEFEEHTVDGGRAAPEGVGVTTRPGSVVSSLIKVRTHFVPEMIRSADDL